VPAIIPPHKFDIKKMNSRERGKGREGRAVPS